MPHVSVGTTECCCCLLRGRKGVKTANASRRGKTKREDWRLCFRRATIASPASPQGAALMVSISIRGLSGWGNLYSHCQAFFNHLHRLGAICQLAWSSPFFHGLVRGNFPVHPRCLMRPLLLMRTGPLSLTVLRDKADKLPPVHHLEFSREGTCVWQRLRLYAIGTKPQEVSHIVPIGRNRSALDLRSCPPFDTPHGGNGTNIWPRGSLRVQCNIGQWQQWCVDRWPAVCGGQTWQ